MAKNCENKKAMDNCQSGNEQFDAVEIEKHIAITLDEVALLSKHDRYDENLKKTMTKNLMSSIGYDPQLLLESNIRLLLKGDAIRNEAVKHLMDQQKLIIKELINENKVLKDYLTVILSETRTNGLWLELNAARNPASKEYYSKHHPMILRFFTNTFAKYPHLSINQIIEKVYKENEQAIAEEKLTHEEREIREQKMWDKRLAKINANTERTHTQIRKEAKKKKK